MLKFGWHVEQNDSIQVYYSPPVAGQSSQFLKKKNLFKVIESHFERFQGHWIEQRC